MGLTLVEKIAARHADGLPKGAVARAGDFVSIRPRHVMTHDNTGAVIPKFRQIGATKIADPAQPVFAIDHDIQNTTPKNLEKYANIEAFAGVLLDRKSTRLNSSHRCISYAVFCLKKKKNIHPRV